MYKPLLYNKERANYMNSGNNKQLVYTGGDEWDVPYYFLDQFVERLYKEVGEVYFDYVILKENYDNNHFTKNILDFLSTKKIKTKYFVYDVNKNYIELPEHNVALIFSNTRNKIKIKIIGNMQYVELIKNLLEKHYDTTKKASSINWFFSVDGGYDSSNITLETNKKIYDEFYPFLKNKNNNKCSVEEYIKDYLESDSSVLILLGEPGTGKTSFVRNIIVKSNMITWMTYDERLIQSDRFFVDFITSDAELLVIEDADLFLSKRESDDNRIMAKLLNVSDGLIDNLKKKIIFTTNLGQINNIDSAIIRPGRCYDVVNFRKLEASEVVDVTSVTGLDIDINNEMSLAEIFNVKRTEEKQRKIGII